VKSGTMSIAPRKAQNWIEVVTAGLPRPEGNRRIVATGGDLAAQHGDPDRGAPPAG